MSDFVEDEPIEVLVDDKKFLVREPLGPEYDAWVEKYVKVLPSGAYDFSIVAKNKGVLEFVVDAPYKVGDKDFKDAKIEDRVGLLQKLKPSVRNKLIKKVNSIIEGVDIDKKKI